MPTPIWTQGIPSAADICAHEAAHQVRYARGNHGGAMWLVVDSDVSFCTMPSMAMLRVGRPGEKLGWSPTGQKEDAEGHILISNGHAFWQRLDQTRWAARSKYTPIDLDGVPVLWASV